MNILAALTPLSIYRGCSSQKMVWEKKVDTVEQRKFWSSQGLKTQGDQ